MGEADRRGGLLDDAALAASAVVANCAMNRDRQLAGVNSYTRELGFNPLELLLAQIRGGPEAGTAGWLDLCCGSGRALIQARLVQDAGLAGQVMLTGVDLVDAFDPVPVSVPGLGLVCAPVTAWQPARSFDLITCVHGLHYVGDKLAVLTRAARWLTPDGQLIADLDLSAIDLAGGPAAARQLAARLRAAASATCRSATARSCAASPSGMPANAGLNPPRAARLPGRSAVPRCRHGRQTRSATARGPSTRRRAACPIHMECPRSSDPQYTC